MIGTRVKQGLKVSSSLREGEPGLLMLIRAELVIPTNLVQYRLGHYMILD